MQELNCPDYGSLFLKLWETVPLVESRKRIRQHSKDQNETAQKAQEDVSKKIAQYNSLIEQADALFNQGALAQSRELYRQAGLLFPDQPDPKSMMSRIDNQLAAQNQPASKAAPVQTAAAPQQQQQQQQQQEQPAAPPPAKQAGPAKKEAPLNMFQKNEEW